MAEATTTKLDIRQTAPLNSFVAISNDETRIVAIGSSLEELEQKLQILNETEVFLFKTPPRWTTFSF